MSANSTVGQIIYNLQDSLTGYYISSSGTDFKRGETVSMATMTEDEYKASRFNIFQRDLVAAYDVEKFTKLGIQAPPGTRFTINNNKKIMVGRTGVYELDDDIVVTGLKFERPRRYKYLEGPSQEALQRGIAGFEAAETARRDSLAAIKSWPRDETYWQEYSNIHDAYETSYQQAEHDYKQGVNGIYGPYDDDLNADVNFDDVENVIIDFLY